jgi:gluconolactonase
VAFDNNDFLYFADIANAVVYYRDISNKEDNNNSNSKQIGWHVLMKDYECVPLKGPSSLAINNKENRIFICDAGYFGTTSLNNPNGSLYLIELDSKICRPLLLNCLSYPADIIYDDNSQSAYLVETFTNRVIRLIQSPPDIFHSSVFHQFSGRVGPTAIAIDALGNIYVARYEFQTNEKDVDGIISVLNKDGYLVGELIIPKMPEITGLCIPSDKKADTLYFTEKSFNGILKVKLSQFAAEIDKMVENNKFF